MHIPVCCQMKALLHQGPHAIRNASLLEQFICVRSHICTWHDLFAGLIQSHYGRSRREMTNPRIHMWHVSFICSHGVTWFIQMVWHDSFLFVGVLQSHGGWASSDLSSCVPQLIQMVWYRSFMYTGVLQSHDGWASREPVCGGGVIFQWQSGLRVPACTRKTHWYAHAL